MRDSDFIEESRFAKVVDTEYGPALLVASIVINVSGPPQHGSDSWADLLARALRRAGGKSGIVSTADYQNQGTGGVVGVTDQNSQILQDYNQRRPGGGTGTAPRTEELVHAWAEKGPY